MDFDGATYSEELDGPRLRSQLERVRHALDDGEWWTLSELHDYAQGSEAGVSARLRDLRKPKHGGMVVERERCGESGLWRYRMTAPAPVPLVQLEIGFE